MNRIRFLLIRILRKYFRRIDDKTFIQIFYYLSTGKILHLKSPQTFNEKLQWLKLYNKHPEYTLLADKISAKEYVKNTIGEKYIIPTLGIWNKFEDIDFNKLPNQFVLKCNHNSGGIIICKNKSELDIRSAKRIITRCLKQNYFYIAREYPYKDISPKILAEPFMTDESGTLNDYKIFCFNGQPYYIEVDFDRFTQHKRNIYSTNWELMDFEMQYPSDPNRQIKKPDCLPEMLDIATKLSKEKPHVRIDLYVIHNQIYFGEMTFFHEAGICKFTPSVWNKRLGDLINLNN